jgi:hypothetical protein
MVSSTPTHKAMRLVKTIKTDTENGRMVLYVGDGWARGWNDSIETLSCEATKEEKNNYALCSLGWLYGCT